jgi:pyruvate formate lyase activating enzyme
MDQEIIEGHPGRYWHRLDDGRIQCDLCPRYCKLNDGQRGLCFVRGRADDRIVLTTYGRSSGFCIDPIEKRPLNHFLPGTPVLSFGSRLVSTRPPGKGTCRGKLLPENRAR